MARDRDARFDSAAALQEALRPHWDPAHPAITEVFAALGDTEGQGSAPLGVIGTAARFSQAPSAAHPAQSLPPGMGPGYTAPQQTAPTHHAAPLQTAPTQHAMTQPPHPPKPGLSRATWIKIAKLGGLILAVVVITALIATRGCETCGEDDEKKKASRKYKKRKKKKRRKDPKVIRRLKHLF